MSGWRKRTIMEMAQEAGFETRLRKDKILGFDRDGDYTEELEAFAKLVREDERDKWMERTAILIRGEREACARVCEDHIEWPSLGPEHCAAAIRARGEA